MATDSAIPTRGDYERAFQAYVARVQEVGGAVGSVEQDPHTGLYTWAVSVPGDDFAQREQLYEQCLDVFRETEHAYVRQVLRGSESDQIGDRTGSTGSQRAADD